MIVLKAEEGVNGENRLSKVPGPRKVAENPWRQGTYG